MNSSTSFSNAVRYWESKRLLYNVVLSVVAIAVSYRELMEATDQSGREIFGLVVVILILALLANVVYSAVYLPDLLLQRLSFGPIWLRYRWVFFTGGLVLASICVVFVLKSPDPM